MSDDSQRTDAAQRTSLWAVGIAGAIVTLGAVPVVGLRGALGVASGATIATLNLWAIGLLVRRLLGDGVPAAPWALLALVKVTVLFGAVYLLVFSGFADILAVVAGYGALPIGLVVAQLSARPATDEQG